MGRKKKTKLSETNLLDGIEVPVFLKIIVENKNNLQLSPFSFLNTFNNIDIQCDRNSVKRTMEYMSLYIGMKLRNSNGELYSLESCKIIEKNDPYENSPIKWFIVSLKELTEK